MSLVILRICILFVGGTLVQVHGQLPRYELITSNSGCQSSVQRDASALNVTCETNAGSVVAVSDVIAGAKLETTGCPLYFDGSPDFETCCSNKQNEDCQFSFFSDAKYHTDCNGQTSCLPEARTQDSLTHGSCDSFNGTFGSGGRYSHYAYINYYCIEDDKMVEMCSTANELTVQNTEVYIWNRDFKTSAIQSSDTNCNCSVEIDNCDSTINMYTIFKELTGDSEGVCNQTLSIFGVDGVLNSWSCDDNRLSIETNTISATYIYVNLENQRNSTDGKFWLGFEATMTSNITVSCPPTPQKHCMFTTTTQATTTEVTTTEVMATEETTLDTTTILSTTTEMSTTETTPNETTTETSSTTTETPSTTISMPVSTDTSTRLPEISTTAPTTDNFTSVTESQTKTSDNDTGLLVAVIVLSILVAVLLMIIIVLGVCLYKSKSYNKVGNGSDNEKLISSSQQLRTSSQSPSIVDQEKTLINVWRKPEMKDVSCQTKITPNATPPVKKLDKATSVTPPNKTSENGTHPMPPVRTHEKNTNTLSTDTLDRNCQTERVQRKNRRIQADLILEPQRETVACQTEENNEEKLISTPEYSEQSDSEQYDLSSDAEVPTVTPQVSKPRIKRKKLKKKIKKETYVDHVPDDYVRTPTSIDLTDFSVDTGLISNRELNYMEKMRRKMVLSMFEPERLDEQLLKLRRRTSRGPKKKKAKRRSSSSHK